MISSVNTSQSPLRNNHNGWLQTYKPLPQARCLSGESGGRHNES